MWRSPGRCRSWSWCTPCPSRGRWRAQQRHRVVRQRDAPLGHHAGHVLGEHVLHEEQVAGHVVGGGQLLGVALEVHELLGHQHELPHGAGAVLPLELDLLAQQLGQAHVAEGQVEHGVEHGLEPGRHLVDRPDVGGEDPDALPGPDDAGVVAVDHEGELGVAHRLAVVGGQLAHDAEVEVRGPAVVQQPDVAGVHVAVERAVDERRLGPHLEAAAQRQLTVDAAGPHVVEAVERGAVEALHADHAGPAMVPVHLGGGDPGVVAEGADVVAECGLAVGLEDEVELLVGDLVQILDHPRSVEQVTGAGAIHDAGQPVHHPQVAVHAVGDVRSLDLEHGRPPVPQHAPVHLGDRRGRQRHRVELGEGVGRGHAQVVLHDGERLIRGEGRHVVQRAQAGVSQRSGEHARRRGDHLAQLHEGGAERHEPLHQPHAGGIGQSPSGPGVAAGGQQAPGMAHGEDHQRPGHAPRESHPDLGSPRQLSPAEPGEARDGIGHRASMAGAPAGLGGR